MTITIAIFIKEKDDKFYRQDCCYDFTYGSSNECGFKTLEEVRSAIAFKLSNIICNNLQYDFMFKTYTY